MLPDLTLGFALVAITTFAANAARRLHIPHAILLVLVGSALALIPGVPRVSLDPDLVLLLLLPPLLYWSGVGMSWRGFRENLRPILLLAVGCVLFTAGTVACVGHYALGLPWAAGWVLGAVVSPPDPVAPMAIARRLHVPQRILTILEGEGLVNDATALILFSFAVEAAETGSIHLGLAAAGFLTIVAGELAWGIGVAWAMLQLRRLARDPQVEMLLSLLTPFLAFWPPHAAGGSGVLATVAAGLYVSWNGARYIAPATRLQGYFVWGLVVYLTEGVVFLLTGLQAHVAAGSAADGGWAPLLKAGLLVSAVVVVVRFVWVFPGTYVPRWLSPALRRREARPGWQVAFMVGFTGLRGGVSLVAALSIPLQVGSADFPGRGMILFVTFCVILVTLVGQGTALPWVIRGLGLAEAGAAEAAIDKQHEVAARVSAAEAVLARLDALAAEGAPAQAVATLRRRHQDRRAEYASAGDTHTPGNRAADVALLSLQLVAAERQRVAAIYADSALSDDARRRIERELDLEDARIRHAAESATGDLLAADPDTARNDEPDEG